MQTIGLDKLPAWILNVSKRHKAAIARGLTVAAMRGASELKMATSLVKPYPPVHTGRYKSSWKHEALVDPKSASDKALDGVVARVWNEAPYASVIELGARPGRIPSPYRGSGRPRPFQSLVRWAYLKFLRPARRKRKPGGGWQVRTAQEHFAAMARKASRPARAPGAGVGGRKRNGNSAAKARMREAYRIAVAVQEKLHRKGYKARRVMTNPQMRGRLAAVAAREAELALLREFSMG